MAAERRPLPPVIEIEPTNYCNLRCTKCPTGLSSRSRGFLDPSLLARILTSVERAEVPVEIALSGAGEPTVHPRLVELVRMARTVRNITTIGFATNAVLLTAELARELLEAGVNRLKLSVDATDSEQYAALTGRDAYATVEKNLHDLAEINRTMGYPCALTVKVTQLSPDLDQARRLRSHWAKVTKEVRVTPAHNWGGAHLGQRATSRRVPCPMLWNQIQVLWDGQITLCCFDTMEGTFNMGNASKVDLAEYWRRDPKLRAIRRAHRRGDFSTLPMCARCDLDEYHDLALVDEQGDDRLD